MSNGAPGRAEPHARYAQDAQHAHMDNALRDRGIGVRYFRVKRLQNRDLSSSLPGCRGGWFAWRLRCRVRDGDPLDTPRTRVAGETVGGGGTPSETKFCFSKKVRKPDSATFFVVVGRHRLRAILAARRAGKTTENIPQIPPIRWGSPCAALRAARHWALGTRHLAEEAEKEGGMPRRAGLAASCSTNL